MTPKQALDVLREVRKSFTHLRRAEYDDQNGISDAVSIAEREECEALEVLRCVLASIEGFKQYQVTLIDRDGQGFTEDVFAADPKSAAKVARLAIARGYSVDPIEFEPVAVVEGWPKVTWQSSGLEELFSE